MIKLIIIANENKIIGNVLNIVFSDSIDFFNSEAVKALNTALLKHFYAISFWEIPENYLCPPIPGRADYIHYVADLFASVNNDKIPRGKSIKILDVGVGANCIYPIIGLKEYNWDFVGSDIDFEATISAKKIIDADKKLKGRIDIRLQKDKKRFFENLDAAQNAFMASVKAEVELRFPIEEADEWWGSSTPLCINVIYLDHYKRRYDDLAIWVKGTPKGEVCGGTAMTAYEIGEMK